MHWIRGMQVVLDFLPGYMWDGKGLVSTGVSLAPTQHVNPRTGEPCYYVRPVGWPCGAFIRYAGLVNYIFLRAVDSQAFEVPQR